MTLIPELEREIERVRPVRRARRTLRVSLGIGVALLAGGTAALAAVTGVIPVGSPAKDEFRLKPNEGIGALSSSAVRVLAVQAEDPDGGLPWGLRLAMTTRKVGCLQAARLQDGRLGVLGRDGQFNDDGRFHPIPDSSVGQAGSCFQPDAEGRLIGNVVLGGMTASGGPQAQCSPPQLTTGVSKDELCDPDSVRVLYYGLLGPQASGIVVGGREIPTVGEEGAYLIVEKLGDRRIGVLAVTPLPWNTPITEIRFKDGSSCKVTERGGPEDSCAYPGYSAPKLEPRDVSAPIRVKTWKTGKRWHARVSFRAPVAITDASAAYAIRLSVPSKASPGRRIGTATARNFKRGETVEFQFDQLGGHGRYHGEVTYQLNNGVVPAPQRDGLRVGRVSFRLP